MSFDVNLADLNLQDDLEIGDFGVEDPSTYQHQTEPAPPREDNYELKVTGLRSATEFGSQAPLFQTDENGRSWPVLEITEIEIVRPAELARKVRINQKVKTKPFKRAGAAGEPEKPNASELADLLASFDATRPWQGVAGEGNGTYPTGLALLKEFMETGAIARGRGLWKAFDMAYRDAAFAAAGGEQNLSREEIGKIMQKASIKGMKRFPQNSKGGYIPEVLGPSGDKLRAKFAISRFYPSNDQKVKIAN